MSEEPEAEIMKNFSQEKVDPLRVTPGSKSRKICRKSRERKTQRRERLRVGMIAVAFDIRLLREFSLRANFLRCL